MSIETEEHIAKVRWVKSEKAVRASILLVQQEDLTEVKRVLVVVPAKWKFIEKIEAVRDNSEQEKLSELVFNWRFWDIISYAGLGFDGIGSCETVETKAYYARVFGWKAMADESLRQVPTALERLAINQASQGWARHLKSPDVFKPDGREAELKLWSDWKFSFLNYVKGLDPSMARNMDMVEENVDGNYDFGDMSDETKAKAVRLYSLLTSYLRQRPLKLVRHIKNENGPREVSFRTADPGVRADFKPEILR